MSNCPVCAWPKLPGKPDQARYGTPANPDERSLTDSQYLHALADIISSGSQASVLQSLCVTHDRELDEILCFNDCGRHPKKNPERVKAERRLIDAQNELAAAQAALISLPKEKR